MRILSLLPVLALTACQGGASTCRSVWYFDVDADGYGDPDSLASGCVQTEGTVANAEDCDDTDATVNPESLWYADDDGDGYGKTSRSVQSCVGPSGYVLNPDDCDDKDPGLNPATQWYADQDGDGFGGTSPVASGCEAPADSVANNADCDDVDPEIHPGAPEVCDEIDQDCDGDVASTATWYPDGDGDGYGDPAGQTVEQCESPGDGWSADPTDCDDVDPKVSPGSREICDDGLDQNCDGDDSCALSGTVGLDAGRELIGNTESDGEHGAAVSAVGDLNGDGYPDIAIGEPDQDGTGAVNIRFGAPGGVSSVHDRVIRGSVSNGGFGSAVSPVGDVEADGYADLAVGAPSVGIDELGGVWLFSGPADADLDAGDAYASVTGTGAYSRVGERLAGVDGTLAVLGVNATSRNWYVWLYSEPTGALALSDADGSYYGARSGDSEWGTLPGMALGDLDGDGMPELAFGHPGYTTTDDGSVFVYSSDGGWEQGRVLSGNSADSFLSGRSYSMFGASIAMVPDTNGDGYDDLLIGGPGRGLRMGAAFLFLGGELPKSGDWSDAQASLDGPGNDDARTDFTGAAVSGVPDANGDGLGELLVSAPDTATAWVVYGPVSGAVPLATDADVTIEGALDTAFGTSLTATDPNGDGYGDWIIGAPDSDSAWMFLGGP